MDAPFQNIGKLLIILGLVLSLLGLILYYSPKLPSIGRLPGDIYIQKENFNFYFPVVTCIIISIALSGILYLVRKFF